MSLNEELSQFEEQFLNQLKETEKKIFKLFNTKNQDIFDYLHNLEIKLNSLTQNNDSMLETLSNQKIYIGKLSEFEAFKNKTDNILISHELKIKNSIDEVIFLRDKYHQIITENLCVPGYVGTSCKYKNLSQYLLYNITELNKIKSNKDEGRKELKDLSSKYENVMKSMISLNDKSIERCKDYSNSIKQDTIVIVQNKLKEYDTKNFELKTEICKDKSLNEQKFKEFDEKLEEIKKELNNTFIDKINEILKTINSLNENLEKNSYNIQKNMKDIQNINTNINEIKLNIRDIISNMKSYNFTQALNSKVVSPIYSPRKNIQKIIVRNENVVKEYATDSSKMSKIIKSQNNNFKSNNNEINNSNNNAINNFNNNYFNNNNVNSNITNNNNNLKNNINNNISSSNENSFKCIKLRNIRTSKQTLENTKNSDKIQNFNDISETENYIKNKNVFEENNNSFEQKNLKTNVIKNLKNKSLSINNINKNLIEKKFKNKGVSTTTLNKYLNKETINAKSISPFKEEKKKSIETINKYNSKDHISSHKIINPKIKQNFEGQEELEENHTEKDNSISIKINKNIKLNYDLINQIHENKVLDLYSFSISPPNGKINLKLSTIAQNLHETIIKKQKEKEKDKEKDKDKDIVDEYKLLQKEIDHYKNIKNKVNSQRNIKTDRNKMLKIKNKDKKGLSTERINSKYINNNFNLGTNNPIIEMPPKYNLNFNRTYFDNDYNKEKKNNNNDYLKLKRTLKELNINEQFNYYINK